MINHVLYFFAYSILGWACECLYCGIPARRFINRGFLEGPYCPIYGCGALIVILVLDPLKGHPLLLFLGAMIFTSVLEYVTSWLMEKLFHSKWWDYSERPFNINGRVCLLNSLLFGIMGLAVMYVVHPFICDVFEQIPALARLITAAVLLILFIWDNIHTFHAILRENSDYRMVEDSLKELAVQFKGFQLYSLDEPLSAGSRPSWIRRMPMSGCRRRSPGCSRTGISASARFGIRAAVFTPLSLCGQRMSACVTSGIW